MMPSVSQKQPIVVDLGEDVRMTFRHIPAGRFRMGQRREGDNAEPVTEVEVGEFWMGEVPVTQAQYRVLAGECLAELQALEGNLGSEPSEFKGRPDSPQRPVEKVNWHEARVVARQLEKTMREAGLLPADHVVDLPSEAMWEYACRAGSETEYWSGDGEAALAEADWYLDNSGGESHPVGQKARANDFDLHDMHGNVLEWCLDIYEPVRFRFVAPGAVQYPHMDMPQPKRAGATPAFVTWAGLFTRITAGQRDLGSDDVSALESLRVAAREVVAAGNSDWEMVVEACDQALHDSAWAEAEMVLAEELRQICQELVDTSSDVAEPDCALRGGAWNSTARCCPSATRFSSWPDHRNRVVGFRLCLFPNLIKQELEAGQGAESATGAKARRDDAAVAEVADGADLDAATFPPRSSANFSEES